MLLLIDNYCSFTYNQAHYFGDLGADLLSVRNDHITIAEIEKMNPEKIVLSSGPCTPNEAGVSLEVIRHFSGKIPIFGICLGHQSIGQAFGGRIVHAPQVMHGKVSLVYHQGQGVFRDLPNPVQQVRYHSLVIERATLPDCLEVTAWTQTENGQFDAIMGVRHKTLPVEGVQFHPESILSEHGHRLLKHFLEG